MSSDLSAEPHNCYLRLKVNIQHCPARTGRSINTPITEPKRYVISGHISTSAVTEHRNKTAHGCIVCVTTPTAARVRVD